MTLKHFNRPIGDCAETPQTGRIDGQETAGSQTHDLARPDPRKLFHARWERNKPGFEFLASS